MPAELDNQAPEMDQEMGADASADMGSDPSAMGAEGGHGDQEGAMAKQELIKLANYATNLQEHIQDDEQLEAWVQSKITIAATNIASVYHYLAYEKKIGEYGEQMNSPELSESKKRILKNWLMEAKSKVKELKKLDAEKKKVMEGPLKGGEQPCGECGGSGVVNVPGIQPHPSAIAKVEKYKRLVNATKAAHKRMDANHNGVPDEDEMEEGFGEAEPKEMKVGDTKKTRTGELTKTDTGVVHKNTSYHDDGDEIASNAKSGKGKASHAKAKDAETKKAERGNDIKLPKHTGNTWGMKGGEKFGKKEESVSEAKKKAVKESRCDECGMYESKCSCDHAVKESAKPSAGLSKAKKSAVVKDAKAGKDIGKPGKSFDKVAKSAGGGEKGKKIAAAAMWKNIKETTAYIEEKKNLPGKQEKLDVDKDGKLEKSDFAALRAGKKEKETVKESSDVSRLRELTGRLNRSEKPTLVENREVDQLKALTNLFKG